MAGTSTKTKAAPKKAAAKTAGKVATKATVKAEVKESKGALSASKIETRLKKLHDVIAKHEGTAKEARVERDQLILDEIKGGASVSVVADAAGVTRQHVYKNILEKKN